jgi:hypothetical protein
MYKVIHNLSVSKPVCRVNVQGLRIFCYAVPHILLKSLLPVFYGLWKYSNAATHAVH